MRKIYFRMFWRVLGAAPALVLLCLDSSRAQPIAVADIAYAEQGWSEADRSTFYTTTQGSHMMPYAWFKALRRLDADAAFAGDSLRRYGYLRNDVSPANPEGLPVGFTIDTRAGFDPPQIGMTCAACHTAQLDFVRDGATHSLRLDGAPANADFQQFLTDLAAVARATVKEPDRFDAFAKSALGEGASAAKAARLKTDFGQWVKQFGDFMDQSLPADAPWGPGRLDAFGMIFNRVTARDLGVPSNFRTADAPVSYPFLWNASRQDHTQWNGGVPNGLYIQALGRNTGEVYGVFADFAPRRVLGQTPLTPAQIDYKNNSADFAGLQTLEEKIAVLRPPPWPRDIFPVDDALAAAGKPLFEAHCGSCHSEQASPDLPGLWATPVRAVGTDAKMVANSVLTADPGLLTGALMPPPAIGARIADPARKSDILGNVVIGSQLAEAFIPPIPSPAKLARSGVLRALRKDLAEHFPGESLDASFGPQVSASARFDAANQLRSFVNARLSNMFNPPRDPAGPAYESRVLHGIWATAPYLHNGSVPNLWELLRPPGERLKTFMVGSRVFDPKNVGYASDASPFKAGAFVADPAKGNGNGGHEYGTTLSEADRWALIEYLKTL